MMLHVSPNLYTFPPSQLTLPNAILGMLLVEHLIVKQVPSFSQLVALQVTADDPDIS